MLTGARDAQDASSPTAQIISGETRAQQEAAECGRFISTELIGGDRDRSTAAMMRESAAPEAERPGLEDVAEEEDVFAAEGSRSAAEPRSCQEVCCVQTQADVQNNSEARCLSDTERCGSARCGSVRFALGKHLNCVCFRSQERRRRTVSCPCPRWRLSSSSSPSGSRCPTGRKTSDKPTQKSGMRPISCEPVLPECYTDAYQVSWKSL